jgi:hypothetical protein
MSDNGLDGVENATHNTFAKQTWILTRKISRFAFSITSGSLSLVKYPVLDNESYKKHFAARKKIVFFFCFGDINVVNFLSMVKTNTQHTLLNGDHCFLGVYYFVAI